MKLIGENEIDMVLGKLEALNKNPFDYLFDQLDKAQPAIVDYLYEVEGEDINEDERDLLINFSTLGWHIIKELLNPGRKVSADYLDECMEKNVALLENREEPDGEEIDESVLDLFSEINEQPVLMGFLINLVVDRPDDYSGTIRDEVIPIIILHIKTVVDSLVTEM